MEITSYSPESSQVAAAVATKFLIDAINGTKYPTPSSVNDPNLVLAIEEQRKVNRASTMVRKLTELGLEAATKVIINLANTTKKNGEWLLNNLENLTFGHVFDYFSQPTPATN